jgi:hypothetical protein
LLLLLMLMMMMMMMTQGGLVLSRRGVLFVSDSFGPERKATETFFVEEAYGLLHVVQPIVGVHTGTRSLMAGVGSPSPAPTGRQESLIWESFAIHTL